MVVYFLVSCGHRFFSLAIAGLGKYTSQGSAFFSNDDFGWWNYPSLQGKLADIEFMLLTFIPVLCFCCAFYGWKVIEILKKFIGHEVEVGGTLILPLKNNFI
jgi:FHS family L-fucose permease-like MFS transporter